MGLITFSGTEFKASQSLANCANSHQRPQFDDATRTISSVNTDATIMSLNWTPSRAPIHLRHSPTPSSITLDFAKNLNTDLRGTDWLVAASPTGIPWTTQWFGRNHLKSDTNTSRILFVWFFFFFTTNHPQPYDFYTNIFLSWLAELPSPRNIQCLMSSPQIIWAVAGAVVG